MDDRTSIVVGVDLPIIYFHSLMENKNNNFEYNRTVMALIRLFTHLEEEQRILHDNESVVIVMNR